MNLAYVRNGVYRTEVGKYLCLGDWRKSWHKMEYVRTFMMWFHEPP